MTQVGTAQVGMTQVGAAQVGAAQVGTVVDTRGIRADYPDPLWIQAVNLIQAEIDSGALPKGSRLPPERELCQSLGISRVTLRRALAQLVEDGVLGASHGRGWYVIAPGGRNKEWPNSLESFSETAERMGLAAESVVLRAEILPATLDEAEELAIAPAAGLFHLERVRLLGGIPIACDITRIAASLAPGLAAHDFTSESLYAALAEAGVEPTRADSTIEARESDAATAAHLGVDVGTPLLVMHQLAVDATGRPLFVSTIRYAGDRYRLRTSFARSSSL
ncbi:MAG TPA: GntR family transcriptional regulator [Galbitalea sp.]|jgi:DNA-binding GntR family transcriptional regulator